MVTALVSLGGFMPNQEAEFRLSSDEGYAVFTLDLDGNILASRFWNACPDTKYNVVGEHFSVLYPKEAREAKQPEQELQVTKMIGHSEVEGWRLHNDGSMFWASITITAMKGAMGVVVGFIKIVRDLTRRKLTEEKNKELQHNVVQRDEFLAMLAHELRNPLAVIVNGVQVLGQAYSGCSLKDEPNHSCIACPAQKDGFCENIHGMILRQATHLTHLVNDLLDVCRMNMGKIILRRKIMNLNDAIQVGVEQNRRVIDEKKHALIVSDWPTPIKVYSDLTRMTQVVANLITNSAKYTPPGGTIIVVSKIERNNAIIRIKDNGIGMTPEQIEHIFDLFSQVDHSLERSQGGLGIGLALVKNLVQMHDGKVEAFSEGLGKGSEFVLTLPLSPSNEETVAEDSEVGGVHVARTILVVDDMVDAAHNMAALLKFYGHKVWTANDGEIALNMIEQVHPEVILLDIGLPNIDGYEIAGRIRAKYGESIVVVAVTGYGQEEDRRRSAESGFHYHLIKPVEPKDLAKILRAR